MAIPPRDLMAMRASVRDPQAFVTVFERYYDAIFRYLAQRVDIAVAEDLAAETFAEAFRHRGRFDPARGSVRAWLFGIATNLLGHHRRAERLRLRLLGSASGEVTAEEDEDAARRADAAGLRPVLVDGLLALAEADRDALVLAVWGGLRYEEIAQALAVPLGTVRSRLHRARRELRAHLAAAGVTTTGEEVSHG